MEHLPPSWSPQPELADALAHARVSRSGRGMGALAMYAGAGAVALYAAHKFYREPVRTAEAIGMTVAELGFLTAARQLNRQARREIAGLVDRTSLDEWFAGFSKERFRETRLLARPKEGDRCNLGVCLIRNGNEGRYLLEYFFEHAMAA